MLALIFKAEDPPNMGEKSIYFLLDAQWVSF
jgi:hypothetical protein